MTENKWQKAFLENPADSYYIYQLKRIDERAELLNTDRPQDFTGYSLSVSDIVALRQNGVVSGNYVDSVGFADVPAFLPENYLKNAEMAMEMTTT